MMSYSKEATLDIAHPKATRMQTRRHVSRSRSVPFMCHKLFRREERTRRMVIMPLW